MVSNTDAENAKKQQIKILMSSLSNEWYTPVEYVEAAREVMGAIDLDPASSEAANETVRATMFYTKEMNGLVREWRGKVWLNPPYGGLPMLFIKKLLEEYRQGNVTEAVVLLNATRTDTRWFCQLWGFLMCFTDHRINFRMVNGHGKNRSTHGSVFVYLGPQEKRFARVFCKFGAIVKELPKD